MSVLREHLRRRLGTSSHLYRVLAGVLPKPVDQYRSRRLVAPLVEATHVEGKYVELSLASLPEDTVVPVDDRVCVLRRTSGEVRAFARRCTHEGADLAHGRIAGREVICAQHNVHFALSDGKSPCELPPLATYPCEVEGDRVRIRTESALGKGAV